jgi:ketosteroid isomerase-like protein
MAELPTEAVLEIQRLVARSVACIDEADRDAFAAGWWEDSVWNVGAPVGEFAGIEAIRQAGEDVLWSVWSLMHHLVSAVDVMATGPDAATARSTVIAICVRRADQLTHVVGARYVDAFTRRDGEWRIARRDIVTAFLVPLKDAEALPIQALAQGTPG